MPGSTAIMLAARGPAEHVARGLAGQVAEEEADLAALLGRQLDLPLQLRIGVGREEFAALQPANRRAPGWAAGVAYPDLGLVVLDGLAAGRTGDIRAVLRHEVAHVALGRVARESRMPRWFTEGFAIVHAGEWSLSRSAVLARAVGQDALIPVEELGGGWPSSPTDVDLAYAQSASLVAFLAGQDEGLALRRLVAGLGEGLEFDAAIRVAYRQPLAGVELDWKRSLQARWGFVPVLLDNNLLWIAAAGLSVLAWLRVRAVSRRRLRELAASEVLAPPPDLEAEHARLEQAAAAAAAATLQETPASSEPAPPTGKGPVLH